MEFIINLDAYLLGNTLMSYIKAVIAFAVLVAVFKSLQWVILKRLAGLAEQTETDIDDTLIKIFKSLRPSFYYFVAFYFALKFISLTSFVNNLINGILLTWIIYQIIIGVQIFVDYVIRKKFEGDPDPSTKAAAGYLSMLAKGALWVIGVLLVLSNLGINITSLVAGLGIGGVAIAFALQGILADLFSSFALYFDKPFQIGDFIVVGKDSGTVEKIGIKSTRIRARTGEELIISNKELTEARVQNFKRLAERRSIFSIGVLYETSQSKLKKIPSIIEKIVQSAQKKRFYRTHFKGFGDSALMFEVSYYVQSNDYTEFMNIQQKINLDIFEAFGKEGISFAYPTQTIHINKG